VNAGAGAIASSPAPHYSRWLVRLRLFREHVPGKVLGDANEVAYRLRRPGRIAPFHRLRRDHGTTSGFSTARSTPGAHGRGGAGRDRNHGGDGSGPRGSAAEAGDPRQDHDPSVHERRRRDVMTTAAELFERIGQKIVGQKDLLTSIGAVYKFVLDGAGGGTYLVDLKQALTVTQGDGPASCTVLMSASDFVDLFEGRANGQTLFFTGKLKVEGDMGLALKLQQLTGLLK
jgi:SCP-2 sterol transfer family